MRKLRQLLAKARCVVYGHRMTLVSKHAHGWVYACAHRCGKTTYVRRTILRTRDWT